jgi:hypothetical protein
MTPNALNIVSMMPLPGPFVADDWLCQDALPVTDIHWWGSYMDIQGNPIPKPGDALQGFFFSIYKDVPAGADPDPDVTWSHPGERIWGGANIFTGGDLVEEFYAEIIDPDTGNIIEWKYQYNAYLGDDEWEWFHQDPGENVYWLTIVAIMKDPSLYNWGWETSCEHWNDDAVRGNIYGPWEELRYPDGHPLQGDSIDMAFELTTVPIPGAVWLLGSGLLGLVGLRRRQS